MTKKSLTVLSQKDKDDERKLEDAISRAFIGITLYILHTQCIYRFILYCTYIHVYIWIHTVYTYVHV